MKQYIDGALVKGAGDLMHVYNPATGQEEASVSGATPAQALEALQAAQRAFAEWSALSIAQRERHILHLADAIESCRSEVVDTLIAETGKPIEGKVLAFLKPCDTYSFNQLLTEHRFDREKVYAVGIPCEGMADISKVKAIAGDGIVGVDSEGEKLVVIFFGILKVLKP